MNSIYTFGITSAVENDELPSYTEECPYTLAAAYSGDDGQRGIVTTDPNGECTAEFSGTSASASVAAGIIALTLEANPKLTWRDVMYLIVLTARPDIYRSIGFFQNKRGLLVSSRYGFGLMDAGRMVELARGWTNVPSMQTCSTNYIESFM